MVWRLEFYPYLFFCFGKPQKERPDVIFLSVCQHLFIFLCERQKELFFFFLSGDIDIVSDLSTHDPIKGMNWFSFLLNCSFFFFFFSFGLHVCVRIVAHLLQYNMIKIVVFWCVMYYSCSTLSGIGEMNYTLHKNYPFIFYPKMNKLFAYQ